MEEYQTIRCSFENYCKKCSWIYINQPRISKITRITEHCLTTQGVLSKEVQVFYNDNRSTNRYYGERCCYGERTVFFIAEGTISTKTVSQYPLTTDGSSTTLHLPVSSESHDNVPDIVTRTTNNGQSTIWLPVMIGSVGLLLILLAFYILCRMRGRRKPKKNASEKKTYSGDLVVPQESSTEYSTIEETEELKKALIHVQTIKNQDNYFVLEQISHNETNIERNTTQINVYNSHEYIYNVLFEKPKPTGSDVDLYNHLEESDYVYNHINDTERGDRQIENAEYSCTLQTLKKTLF
ncbi:uncharacterized protein LOC130054667 isoform X2 [Ostrea edulis]|uniref:uncharacterized protein LOC130054667 isoform X2 n=1 Tax=Ostrea edulis TaxID=37623 RepID=UPI0024AF67CD|nr:uncharacterized protein LOC130054667 isoform X2 [Ostrea edulis]